MSVEIRRYGADGARKSFDRSRVASARYTVEKHGGYTDGTISAVGDDVDDVEAVVTDRFEVWDSGRRYRGYVNEVNPSEDEPGQMEIGLYGRMIDLTWIVLDSRYTYASEVDVSVVFAEIAAEVKAVHPDIVVEANVVGVSIAVYDARGKTAEEAVQDLLTFAAATACFGFDVDDDGRDRLYLRVLDVSTDATADVVVGLQGPTVSRRNRRHSIADLFTVAVIEGATPKYPQKLPNGSFEVLRSSAENDGNLVENWGFENAGSHWSLNDGASVKQAEDGNSPHTGVWCAEIDTIAHFFTPSESIVQQDLTPGVALQENTDYLLSFYATPERGFVAGDPPVLRYRVYWLDAGGATIVWDQGFAENEVLSWKYYSVTSRTPPNSTGLTGFRVEFIPESGTWGPNAGVWIDDVTLSDATKLYAVGWATRPNGTGEVSLLNWAKRPGYHGNSCLDIVVSGCTDHATNHVDVITSPDYVIPVLPGEVYTWSGYFKSHYVDEAPPVTEFMVLWKDANGDNTGTPHVSTLSAASPVLDWTYTETFVAVPSGAFGALVKLRFISDGGIMLDALSFRNRAEPSEVYVPEGSLNLRFRTDEVVTSLENAEVHDAYATWGRRDKVISESLVDTIDEAMQLAKVEFLDAARFIPEPEITFEDDERVFAPWLTARFIGRRAANWQDGVTPIIKVEGQVSDDRRTETVQFARVRPTTEDILRRIEQEQKRDHQDQGIGASGAGTSAGGGGGAGATGPAGPAGPPGADGADGADGLSTLYEPLTNGDAGAPELIFVDGDVVMVPV